MKIAEKMFVTHPLGLHLRSAARLVLLVARYQSEVIIQTDYRRANAKSILGLMTLGAVRGSELEVCFDGEDAEEALVVIREFFKLEFGEKEEMSMEMGTGNQAKRALGPDSLRNKPKGKEEE